MWYIVEAVVIVAIYSYKPEIGVWMNYWLRYAVAWARSLPPQERP
jgi:hypothetical protein